MKNTHVHADWYHDGIEDGRDLWRLDLPDVQIQASIDVTNADDEMDGAAPEYGTKAELFIEHDVRGGGPTGDDRTKYSGECFDSSPDELRALLAMCRADVEKRLGYEIRRVKLLPSDPAYCK